MWIACDEHDQDPASLWAAGVTALGSYVDVLPGGLDLATLAGRRRAAAVVINALERHPDGLCVVIDNAHLAGSAIAELQPILDLLPDSIHLLFTTAAELPLEVLRMRAQGRAHVISPAQLRLTTEQAAVVLAELGVTVGRWQAGAVVERSGGWLGAVLAIGTLMADACVVTPHALDPGRVHRAIAELVAADVRRVPAEMLRDLARLSVVEVIGDDLAAALVDHPAPADMLAQASRITALVESGTDGRSWRLQPAVRAMLADRLRTEHPHEYADLRNRATAWWRARRETVRQLDWLLRPGAPARVDAHEDGTVQTARPAAGLAGEVPRTPVDDAASGVAREMSMTAGAELMTGRLAAARHQLTAIADAVIDWTVDELAELDIMRFRVSLWSGDYRAAHRALGSAPPDTFHTIQRAAAAAELLAIEGRLEAAGAAAALALELVAERVGADHPGLHDLYRAIALVRYESGDHEQAALAYIDAVDRSRSSAPACAAIGLAGLARVYLAQDRLSDAEDAINSAAAHLAMDASPHLIDLLAGVRTRVALADGDVAGAIALAAGLRGPRRNRMTARALLAAGHVDKAAAELADTRTDQRWRTARHDVDDAVLRARVALAAGDAPRARRQLKHAIAVAGPEGLVQPFLEDGPDLLPELLLQASAVGDERFVRSLQRRDQTLGISAPHPTHEAMSSTLTPREREVLVQLRLDRSTREIAAGMSVSVNTVRTHVKALYKKLGISSRAEAARVADAIAADAIPLRPPPTQD